jgi:hypothetical protein
MVITPVFMKKAVLGAVAALVALALGAGVASAAEGTITVTAAGPVSVTVDGVEAEKLPVEVQPGSRVCILRTPYYASEGERWTFERWSHGPTGECVTLATPGTYRAVLNHELLLQIKSAVNSEQRSLWAPFGVPLALEVPASVNEGESTRYRFSRWSEGHTPFLTINVILPFKPSIVEVTWVKEHLVTLQGPEGVSLQGRGWHADGADVAVQAVDTVPAQSSGERLKFAGWESLNFPPAVLPNAKNATMTLKVTAPSTLKATYDKQFFVVVRNPFGTLKRDWVNAGGEVVLETPPIEEIVPELDRFVFVRWEGMQGLVSTKVSGVVNAPVDLTAVYEHQVKIAVTGPYGASGGGWYKQGATATIAVPSAAVKYFFLQDVFAGFAGYGKQPAVSLVVREPVALTALYRREVNLKVFALVGVIPLIVAGLVVGDWMLRRRLGRATAGTKGRNRGTGGRNDDVAAGAKADE